MAEFTTTPPSNLSLPQMEQSILDSWDDSTRFPPTTAFFRSLELNQDKPRYSFYDGPPFATGLPHHGHVLAGTIKDIVTRYAHQTGHHVERRFGWDCHGVPVENEINKKHKIASRAQVEEKGIAWYNDECRSIVQLYVGEWRRLTRRLGRWIDFDNDYKTMDVKFMQSVWSVFRRLWDLGNVYRGVRVMPLSTALGTPMSKHEVGPECYANASDPSIVVSFPIVDDPEGAEFVAWTTTPWTLPSNLALCVNKDVLYVRVKDLKRNKLVVMAEARLTELFPPPPSSKDKNAKPPAPAYEVVGAPFPGSELVGKRYTPLFDYFVPTRQPAYFTVLQDPYVTTDSGTGVVHLAPAFGEDDFRVCTRDGVVTSDESEVTMPCPVDDEGLFLPPVDARLVGKHVKHAETTQIIYELLGSRLLKKGSIEHSVPFCSRSRTPLIYKTVPSWFVRVSSVPPGADEKDSVKERMMQILSPQNEGAPKWVPDFVGSRRFHEWIAQSRDWNVSRNRYWGTPIPIWTNKDGSERVCIGSIEELRERSGRSDIGDDLHRQYLDDVEIPSSRPGGEPLRRVTEVFDCWFESGSMPYAQQSYMFTPGDMNPKLPAGFPADFIAEGLDQTRGWFYTLMILSTSLFGVAPFKNVVVNGLVLAADGKKMSKSLKNYPPPEDIMTRHGADALRMYLVDSPVVRAEPLRFVEAGVVGVVREVFIPWLNAHRFFIQNVRRLHAKSPTSWDSSLSPERAKASTNVMDQWILAEARDLTLRFRQEMTRYHLYKVTAHLVRFINQLTNWYVRLNRQRLKGQSSASASGGDEENEEETAAAAAGGAAISTEEETDTLAALSTLYEVLFLLCRLMAPFTPFLTEYMYQGLAPPGTKRREQESVHFLMLPEAAPLTPEESRLISTVNTMQNVIYLGRNAREKGKIKNKKPCVKVVIVSEDARVASEIDAMRSYIEQELNAFQIEFASNPDEWGKVQLNVNLAVLGKRLSKEAAGVIAELKASADPKKVLAAIASEEGLTIKGHKLQVGDVSGAREFDAAKASQYVSASSQDGSLMIVVDKTETPQVLASYIERELVAFVQKLRKRSDMVPEDVVVVAVEALSCKGNLDASAINRSIQEGLIRNILPFSSVSKFAVRRAWAENESVDLDAGSVQLNVGLFWPYVEFPKESQVPLEVQGFVSSLGKTLVDSKAFVAVKNVETTDAGLKLARGVDYL